MRVTRGVLVTHRYTSEIPRCRTSQYSRTFIPLLGSKLSDLAHPVFDCVGLGGFKSRRTNAFSLAYAAVSFLVFYCLHFLFLSIGLYYGAGVFGLIRCQSLSLSRPHIAENFTIITIITIIIIIKHS